MRVAAVVVSHGHADELATMLPALAKQVDELIVVANIPGSVATVPDGTRILANDRPLGFAANANLGIAASDTELVLVANPDAIPAPDTVTILRRFMEEHPRCGIAGPQLRYPDGRAQPSRRAFPTVAGTLVRRTPLRLLFPAFERQRKHYLLDERPTEPAESDWLLGAFLLLRREMVDEIGGFDAGMRMYVEDLELCYRASKAGWERWYVPAALVTHAYDAAIDRSFLTHRTIWHARSMLRFLRKHPERLRALW
jgi:N-acetylglucosaminyl-diphospho-decaprenol L-rhamnosyltransferase